MKIFDFISRRRKKSLLSAYEEAAVTIETFLDGTCGKWDWDDFTSIRSRDTFLESVRMKCIEIAGEYPSDIKGHYCSKPGLKVLADLARSVRERSKSVTK